MLHLMRTTRVLQRVVVRSTYRRHAKRRYSSEAAKAKRELSTTRTLSKTAHVHGREFFIQNFTGTKIVIPLGV